MLRPPSRIQIHSYIYIYIYNIYIYIYTRTNYHTCPSQIRGRQEEKHIVHPTCFGAYSSTWCKGTDNCAGTMGVDHLPSSTVEQYIYYYVYVYIYIYGIYTIFLYTHSCICSMINAKTMRVRYSSHYWNGSHHCSELQPLVWAQAAVHQFLSTKVIKGYSSTCHKQQDRNFSHGERMLNMGWYVMKWQTMVEMHGCKRYNIQCRADSRLAPSQWETPLQSNAVSHWLGANLESALQCVLKICYGLLFVVFGCGRGPMELARTHYGHFTSTEEIIRLL